MRNCLRSMKGDLRHASFEGSLHLGSHIVASDLHAKPMVLNLDTVRRHPLGFGDTWFTDRRRAEEEFRVVEICQTRNNRWFLVSDGWEGVRLEDSSPDRRGRICAATDDHGRYLEVSAQEAAAWFVRAETDLPEPLERLVNGANAPFTTECDGNPSATASPAASGTGPSPSRPNAPRGTLDERAAIQLKKNPSLTSDQLAAILGCSPTTLRSRAKCPLLAAVKAQIRAERDVFRDQSSWRDRRADGDDD
jgi:hypothetical protein